MAHAGEKQGCCFVEGKNGSAVDKGDDTKRYQGKAAITGLNDAMMALMPPRSPRLCSVPRPSVNLTSGAFGPLFSVGEHADAMASLHVSMDISPHIGITGCPIGVPQLTMPLDRSRQ